MNERVAIAPVRKTVHVKVPIAHAFEVFTSVHLCSFVFTGVHERSRMFSVFKCVHY